MGLSLLWLGILAQIGVVDMDRIRREYVDLQIAQAEIERMNREWVRQKDSLEQEIERLRQQFRQASPAMTDEQRLEILDQVEALETDLQRFVQRVWGPDGEYVRRSREILQPYLDRMHEVIQSLASEMNLRVVVDIREAGVIFWEPDVDLTDMVLEELNRTAVGTLPPLRVAVAPFLVRKPETRQRGWGEVVEEAVYAAIRGGYNRIDAIPRVQVQQVAQRLNARSDNITEEMVREIGTQLNADVVIWGEVEWRGGKVQFTVRFIDFRNGVQVRAVERGEARDTRTEVEARVRSLVQGVLERKFPEVTGQ